MIETHGLARRYGDVTAVDGIDLAVPEGSVLGLLGPNGAGKSTTLQLLLGLTRPTAGSATVLGRDPWRDGPAFRREIAFVPETKSFYAAMRVCDFVRFYAAFFADIDGGAAGRRLDHWGIRVDRRLDRLSSGERLRTLLAAVLARRARLFILDEPTEGLDAGAVEDVLEALVGISGEARGIVLATHRIGQVERICDRVAILDRGRLVVTGDPDDLRDRWKRIVVRGVVPPSAAEWPHVAGVRKTESATELLVSDDVDAVARRLAQETGLSPEVLPMSLREIYLAVVPRGRHDR